MTNTVNAAMVEIQGAVLARSLYPDGHPRIRACEEKAYTLLSEGLSLRKEITVFAVGERVIFDDQVLPASASLAVTLFRILREQGIDHMTFRAGLRAEELQGLLQALSRRAEGESTGLEGTAHVSLGAIVKGGGAGPAAAAAVSARALSAVAQASDSLSDVWVGIQQDQQLDSNLLGDIVATLSRVVDVSGGSLVPLASLKSHDEYTYVHITNVAILTMSLGEALGFSPTMTHELGVAAILHDVGKLAVPLELLNKNGRFTDEEFRLVQIHPVEGARMLLHARGVPELASVVAYEHHIRLDGSGYPSVPPGWKLNLASRICQLADVYDALRTDRPYRAGMPPEKISKIMRGDAGTYFDPDLLDVFMERVVPLAAPEETGAASGPQEPAPTPATSPAERDNG